MGRGLMKYSSVDEKREIDFYFRQSLRRTYYPGLRLLGLLQ